VKISIFKENIQIRKYMVVKNNKDKNNFIAEVIILIKDLITNYINSKKDFECIVQEFTNNIDNI